MRVEHFPGRARGYHRRGMGPTSAESRPADSAAPATAERALLLAEYAECGHFERLDAQLSFNYLMVFLAATGGSLTVFRNLTPESRDLHILAAVFGFVLSFVFLLSAERRSARSRATRDRALELERLLGLQLHQGRAERRPAFGPQTTTTALFRLVYAGAALVWIYAGAHVLLT